MDTEFKSINLRTTPGNYAFDRISAAYPDSLSAERYRQDLASPDYPFFVSSRLIWSVHSGGSDEWSANFAPGGSSPDSTTWRTIHRGKYELAPGTRLGFKVIGVASGGWKEVDSSGNGAEIQVSCTIDTSGETVAVFPQYTLPASEEADGLEPTGLGESWEQLYACTSAGWFQPELWTDNPASQSKFAEWPTLTCVVQVRGNARVIHASLWEVPFEHVSDHEVEASTLADWPSGDVPFAQPQIEQADGGTFEEHRFGTYRGLHAAYRQALRYGPHIASWTAHTEGTMDVTDTDPTPVSVTSTSPVGLSIGSHITRWSTDNPGYCVAANPNGRVPENTHTRTRYAASSSGEQYIASVPVRCRVYARFTTNGGSETGRIGFQSSPRSVVWVDVAESSTFAWYTATGWLEASSSSRDNYISLQDFTLVSGGTMEVLHWNVEYGDYPVA